jgi:hypothetical protein
MGGGQALITLIIYDELDGYVLKYNWRKVIQEISKLSKPDPQFN